MDRSASRPPEPQSTGAVLMVRPACFGFNPQTAASNAFQATGAGDAQQEAVREFDGLVQGLRQANVEVIVAQDPPLPPKPDAIFPNNWVSFHRDGTVVLYPMLAANRRLERSQEVLRQVTQDGYRIETVVDLSHRESAGKYLEGTGSLVLDRVNRLGFACLSPRTDPDVLGEFARALGYELVTFEALDEAARPIYHTNVLLAIGGRFAVFCSATVRRSAQRAAVLARLRGCGRDVIDISVDQMRHFAGNILELASPTGPVIAMSQDAWQAFDAAQRRCLESCGSIVAPRIPVIERVGGGGVRCMLAEIHLPKRAGPLVS